MANTTVAAAEKLPVEEEVLYYLRTFVADYAPVGNVVAYIQARRPDVEATEIKSAIKEMVQQGKLRTPP